jgi:hypothetical protein
MSSASCGFSGEDQVLGGPAGIGSAGQYLPGRDLIADAIAQAQASHTASADGKRAELAAAGRELARTSAARPDQDHRTGPDHPRLPNTALSPPEPGRQTAATGRAQPASQRRGSCNDQFGGLEVP